MFKSLKLVFFWYVCTLNHLLDLSRGPDGVLYGMWRGQYDAGGLSSCKVCFRYVFDAGTLGLKSFLILLTWYGMKLLLITMSALRRPAGDNVDASNYNYYASKTSAPNSITENNTKQLNLHNISFITIIWCKNNYLCTLYSKHISTSFPAFSYTQKLKRLKGLAKEIRTVIHCYCIVIFLLLMLNFIQNAKHLKYYIYVILPAIFINRNFLCMQYLG